MHNGRFDGVLLLAVPQPVNFFAAMGVIRKSPFSTHSWHSSNETVCSLLVREVSLL